MTIDRVLARKMWRTLEPYHGMIYFVPEAVAEYDEIGLAPGRMGYFASRSAEWAAAEERLKARGWLDAGGVPVSNPVGVPAP